jgi:hypothetical protein
MRADAAAVDELEVESRESSLCVLFVMCCVVSGVPCYVIICVVMFCYVVLSHVLLCGTCFDRLCYVVLCYVLLCYVRAV